MGLTREEFNSKWWSKLSSKYSITIYQLKFIFLKSRSFEVFKNMFNHLKCSNNSAENEIRNTWIFQIIIFKKFTFLRYHVITHSRRSNRTSLMHLFLSPNLISYFSSFGSYCVLIPPFQAIFLKNVSIEHQTSSSYQLWWAVRISSFRWRTYVQF